MGSLTGKVAIVTGASRGIGRAIAMRLAKDGALVILCARDEKALDEAVQGNRRRGRKCDFDSTRSACSRRIPAELVDFAVDVDQGIDIVVNNAGATKRGVFLELTDDDWARRVRPQIFRGGAADARRLAASEGVGRFGGQYFRQAGGARPGRSSRSVAR